ncbi:CubicO group peptidase (beta-lactamase class C family) [Crossiella equi]|uniref:CubicO group peptidase (Beta-lactamase class C family) n=1 Tax=Crossiella equi TaxID=130796 RepID=A0ABS5ACI3_9PSEU|nr:serine hydrolase domain-containing protein [Crossiella equi]MBP2474292.1 CubicO group peptidase (beta-lactamase class C family) [Crossiella equi]
MHLDGQCDPAFAQVREAFAEGLTNGEDLGAAVSVRVGGRTVVDLWGGGWRPDTVVNLFSATKGVLAACAHRLVRAGQLDPEAPVARYWPEFAARDKGGTTVAQLLAHQAGLPALRVRQPPGSLYDWAHMTAVLAAEQPWWRTTGQHGYHGVTWGWLAGELLRRVSGRTPRELVAALGLDLHVGLPAEHLHRVVRITSAPVGHPAPGEPGHEFFAAMVRAGSMTHLAFLNPPDLLTPEVMNSPAWRAAEIPAANGHGNARALAELYAGLARPGGPRPVARADGHDEVLLGHTRFGEGFMLPGEIRPFSPNPEAFGHPGAGGALGFADPAAELGFGFTPDRTIATPHGPDPRWRRIVPAVYACL